MDDDLSTLELYKKYLSLNNFNVVGSAKDGKEAVYKYQNFIIKPDFIIMDYHMPIKNGIEATKDILKIESSVKIIFVSGDITIKEKALTIGAVSFIEKPTNFRILINEIKNCLNQK